MISSADVRTDTDARQWEARLNREWPHRERAAAWIVTRICGNSADSPRVVELACGAGYLAEILFQQLPSAHYCGFDLSPYLLEFARSRLRRCITRKREGVEIEFRCADLVRDNWTQQLQSMGWVEQVDAVVSLQALHDLGGLEQQTEVLAQARELLRPGGLLAYADLLFDAENAHPSRFTAAQHEEALRAAGLARDHAGQPPNSARASRGTGAANIQIGNFGCFQGRK